MSDDVTAARAALKDIPLFSDVESQTASISRLGGLTNLVFRVDHGGKAYCLRIPGEGTEEYIDRKTEAQMAEAAARAGVSPQVLFSDAASGLMVTTFLDGFETMSPALFRTRQGAPARAAEAFKQLHTSGETFDFQFELLGMIDDYLKLLSTKDVEFPDGYHDVLKESETVREALNARPVERVACHCDPLCENFLDNGERMWIVDWEYSGMNDPLWDLGDLSVEGEFSAEQDVEMINAYFGGAPGDAEYGRVIIHKAMCDLLWTLWGLIQHANDNPVDDFWAYSTGRFERCKALMAGPAFTEHVRAVRNAG